MADMAVLVEVLMNKRFPTRDDGSTQIPGDKGKLWTLMTGCWSHSAPDRPQVMEVQAKASSIKPAEAPEITHDLPARAIADLLRFLGGMSSFLSSMRTQEPTNILFSAALFVPADHTTTEFFSGFPLPALTILSFSRNVDCQRSAALAFEEIMENEVAKDKLRQVGRGTLDPVLSLLGSHDTEVQRAACAILANLAVNGGFNFIAEFCFGAAAELICDWLFGSAENNISIVKLGGLEPLIRLTLSPNVEVQYTAIGCIADFSTHDANKLLIAKSGVLVSLIQVARPKEIRVQRNIAGVLVNMSHPIESRQYLVDAGAIPVLVGSLDSPDTDVQYYCATALSNIAIDASNRQILAADEPKLVQNLVSLLDSPNLRVQCQAAFTLHNLAREEKYQIEIVEVNGLQPLLRLLHGTSPPAIFSSVSCVQNVSAHPLNGAPIIERDISDLCEDKGQIITVGAAKKIKELVLTVPVDVQIEMIACINVLSLSEVQGDSATALSNLSSNVKQSSPDDYTAFTDVWDKPEGGLHMYLFRFLNSLDATFQHTAAWTIVQLLEPKDPQLTHHICSSPLLIPRIRHLSASAASPPSSSSESDYQSCGTFDGFSEDIRDNIAELARRILEFSDRPQG
ncbi:Vacuolar protein 8 [Ceratobasidium sp. 370]|nr:Vacuolar protein 8 [Ceratobasidium sp. 370]